MKNKKNIFAIFTILREIRDCKNAEIARQKFAESRRGSLIERLWERKLVSLI